MAEKFFSNKNVRDFSRYRFICIEIRREILYVDHPGRLQPTLQTFPKRPYIFGIA